MVYCVAYNYAKKYTIITNDYIRHVRGAKSQPETMTTLLKITNKMAKKTSSAAHPCID